LERETTQSEEIVHITTRKTQPKVIDVDEEEPPPPPG
jgi:hypothetical protein